MSIETSIYWWCGQCECFFTAADDPTAHDLHKNSLVGIRQDIFKGEMRRMIYNLDRTGRLEKMAVHQHKTVTVTT